MRVFVDIDDTLILWSKDDQPHPNIPLIEALTLFARHRPLDPIMVWSGGGMDYAARWAQKYLPEVPWVVVPKYVQSPNPHDLCIDDVLELQVACEVVSPESGVERLVSLVQLAP